MRTSLEPLHWTMQSAYTQLLENAMQATLDNPPSFPEGSKLANGWKDGKGLFLIDGFPRKMDQAILFDEAVSDIECGRKR